MIKRHGETAFGSDATRADAGGIVEKEGPIHVSNVMLLDPKEQTHPPRHRAQREGGTRAVFEALREAI